MAFRFQKLSQTLKCAFKPVIALIRFWIVTHSYAASFSINMCLEKTSKVFLVKKPSWFMVYETQLKIKIATLWTFFPNYAYVSSFLQTKNLHENEIVQLLYNYKCYKIDQNHFRKPLQSSAKNVKNNYPKTFLSFLTTVQFVTSLNDIFQLYKYQQGGGKFRIWKIFIVPWWSFQFSIILEKSPSCLYLKPIYLAIFSKTLIVTTNINLLENIWYNSK